MLHSTVNNHCTDSSTVNNHCTDSSTVNSHCTDSSTVNSHCTDNSTVKSHCSDSSTVNSYCTDSAVEYLWSFINTHNTVNIYGGCTYNQHSGIQNSSLWLQLYLTVSHYVLGDGDDGPPLYSYTRIGCMQEERLQEHRLL